MMQGVGAALLVSLITLPHSTLITVTKVTFALFRTWVRSCLLISTSLLEFYPIFIFSYTLVYITCSSRRIILYIFIILYIYYSIFYYSIIYYSFIILLYIILLFIILLYIILLFIILLFIIL